MKYTTFNPDPYEAHMIAYSMVPDSSHVLDLGCATGYFAEQLQKKGCVVTGVEYDADAAKVARKHCKKVIVGDLEHPKSLNLPKKHFDCVLLLDVIEHLRNADEILTEIHNWIKPNGVLVISTPNIAHISVRWNLLFGKFEYTDVGILDKTHVHFYTHKELLLQLKKQNWKLKLQKYSSDFGQLPLLGGIGKKVNKELQRTTTYLFPNIFAVQFISLLTVHS